MRTVERWLVVLLVIMAITMAGACYAIYVTVKVLSCLEKTLTSVESTVIDLPRTLDARLSEESRSVIRTVERESAAWRSMLANQGNLARLAAVQESEQYRGMLSSEITLTRTTALTLAQEYGDVGRKTAESATRLLNEYTLLPAQVGSRLAPWLDCKGNGACVQAQFTALLGASRVTAGETSKTMRAVRAATPQILENVDKTTGNIARLTKPDSVIMKTVKLVAPLAGGALFGLAK